MDLGPSRSEVVYCGDTSWCTCVCWLRTFFFTLYTWQLKDLNVGVMMRQKNYKIKYCFDVGIVMRLCWSDFTMFVTIEKDLFSHAAIYIDDYFNATDTFFMSGNLTWIKTHCYWIFVLQEPLSCAISLSLSNKGIIKHPTLSSPLPSYFSLFNLFGLHS